MFSLFDLLIVIAYIFILVVSVTGLMILVVKMVTFFFMERIHNSNAGQRQMSSEGGVSNQEGDLFISLVFGIYIGLLTNLWVAFLFKWFDAIDQGSDYKGLDYFPYVIGGAALMVFFTIIFYLLYLHSKKR